MSRHEQGNAALDSIAAEFGIESHRLRPLAAARLQQFYDEAGITDADIGSSDVSIELSSMCLTEPEAVRAEAQRLRDQDALVATVAERTGRSPEDALAALREMFAPLP